MKYFTLLAPIALTSAFNETSFLGESAGDISYDYTYSYNDDSMPVLPDWDDSNYEIANGGSDEIDMIHSIIAKAIEPYFKLNEDEFIVNFEPYYYQKTTYLVTSSDQYSDKTEVKYSFDGEHFDYYEGPTDIIFRRDDMSFSFYENFDLDMNNWKDPNYIEPIPDWYDYYSTQGNDTFTEKLETVRGTFAVSFGVRKNDWYINVNYNAVNNLNQTTSADHKYIMKEFISILPKPDFSDETSEDIVLIEYNGSSVFKTEFDPPVNCNCDFPLLVDPLLLPYLIGSGSDFNDTARLYIQPHMAKSCYLYFNTNNSTDACVFQSEYELNSQIQITPSETQDYIMKTKQTWIWDQTAWSLTHYPSGDFSTTNFVIQTQDRERNPALIRAATPNFWSLHSISGLSFNNVTYETPFEVLQNVKDYGDSESFTETGEGEEFLIVRFPDQTAFEVYVLPQIDNFLVPYGQFVNVLFDEFTSVFFLGFNLDRFIDIIPRSVVDLSSIVESSRFAVGVPFFLESDKGSINSPPTYKSYSSTNKNLIYFFNVLADDLMSWKNETSKQRSDDLQQLRTNIIEFNGKVGLVQFEKVWVNLNTPLYEPCSITCEDPKQYKVCDPNATSIVQLKYGQYCHSCPGYYEYCEYETNEATVKACQTKCEFSWYI